MNDLDPNARTEFLRRHEVAGVNLHMVRDQGDLPDVRDALVFGVLPASVGRLAGPGDLGEATLRPMARSGAE